MQSVSFYIFHRSSTMVFLFRLFFATASCSLPSCPLPLLVPPEIILTLSATSYPPPLRFPPSRPLQSIHAHRQV